MKNNRNSNLMLVSFTLVIAAVLFLSACGPSEAQIAAAIAQTEAARPTETSIPTPEPSPTPTLVPLADLDLADTLIQEGDLPAGYSPAQVRTSPDPDAKFPKPNFFTQIELEKNGNSAGWVEILIYESLDQAEKSYQWFEPTSSENLTVDKLQGVGDSAYTSSMNYEMSSVGLTVKMVQVGFIRCSAVIVATTTEDDYQSPWEYYVKTLDERLTDIVCPYSNQ